MSDASRRRASRAELAHRMIVAAAEAKAAEIGDADGDRDLRRVAAS